MKTYNYLIVEIDSEYENERGGILSNLDYDDTSFIARKAKVIAAPEFTTVKVGDSVLCHHNIFRMKGSTKGNIVKSDFNIEDNKYFVPFTECFMYKRGDDDWVSLSPFCFVKPIKQENEGEGDFALSHDELIKNYTHKGYKKLTGILSYPCKELNHLKDKQVLFTEYSEYEFLIDGELHYKMCLNDIIGHIE